MIAERTPKAAEAGERAQAAKDLLERIRRGEDVAGGLGKPFDVERALKAERSLSATCAACGCWPA